MPNQLNAVTWYSDRELKITPIHFVVAKTSLTNESKLWIINTLTGRYSITKKQEDLDVQKQPWLYIYDFEGIPAFEDPKEAVLYELTWS